MEVSKRGFLAGSSSLLLSAHAALAQEGGGGNTANVPRKKATTKNLFKSPSGWPNAVASSPEGLWVAEQKPRGGTRERYGQTYSDQSTENIWLFDDNGKVLRTLVTEGRNTSGLAWGNGYLWSCALSGGPNDDGVYQIDPKTGKTVSHRQLPLGPVEDGGGIHGADWQNGKLWVFANRFNGAMRLNPSNMQAELVIPFPASVAPRYHGIAMEGNSVWAVTGNATSGYKDAKFGLAKFSATNGRLQEIVDLADGSSDPHGLCFHKGKMISCDAGIHPGWPVNNSPYWGNVFEINIA